MFRILLHLAPPVMLAQLIQALYHIVDSYSDTGWACLLVHLPSDGACDH